MLLKETSFPKTGNDDVLKIRTGKKLNAENVRYKEILQQKQERF